MFRSANIETPCFRNFAEAIKYVQNTRPVGRGPNKGVIPLATSRRRPNVLNIYVEHGRHPMQSSSEPPQHVVRCRYYLTDIVSLYEDGTIVLDAYSSNSTRNLQSNLLWDVGTRGDAVVLAEHRVAPSTDSHLFLRRGEYMYPVSGEHITLIPAKAGQHGGPYRVCGHGYYAGPGRKYHNAMHGKFLKQALKQMRIMSEFSADPQLKMFEGECTLCPGGGLEDYTYTADHLDWIIEQADWSPGQVIPTATLDLLLTPMTIKRQRVFWTQRAEHYSERMAQWAPLRHEIKSMEGRATWSPNFTFLSEARATLWLEMTDSIDTV